MVASRATAGPPHPRSNDTTTATPAARRSIEHEAAPAAAAAEADEEADDDEDEDEEEEDVEDEDEDEEDDEADEDCAIQRQKKSPSAWKVWPKRTSDERVGSDLVRGPTGLRRKAASTY